MCIGGGVCGVEKTMRDVFVVVGVLRLVLPATGGKNMGVVTWLGSMGQRCRGVALSGHSHLSETLHHL